MKLTLISHVLCPYVQRAVIALEEKNMPYERIDIDLANKPNWFLELSPLGKTPVLKVDEDIIFESNVILEFLEDTLDCPLHPQDAFERAKHRSLIEFSSALLADIAGLYLAKEEALFDMKKNSITNKLNWLEANLDHRPWYKSNQFSLVDAVFGPVFRYFDTFERIEGLDLFSDLEKLRKWRANLSAYPSVKIAVTEDYPERLWQFLLKKDSVLSHKMQKEEAI